MTPSVWAIKHPFWPFLIITLMIVLGLAASLRLPRTHLPDLGLDRLHIELSAPALTLEEIETRLVKPAEAELGGVDGVASMTTSAFAGFARIVLELEDPSALARLQTDVEDRVQRIRAEVGAALTRHTITAQAGRSAPLRVVAVTSPSLSLGHMGQLVTDVWQPTLAQVSGVGEIRIEGAWSPTLIIEADPLLLAGVDLTPTDLHRALPAMLSGAASTPAGSGAGLSLRAPLTSELEALPITLSDGRRLPLAELATVRLEDTPPLTIVRHNGNPAVLLTILPQPGVDVPGTANRIDAELERLRDSIPDLEVSLLQDGAETVSESLTATWRTLLEGCALVILVVGIALRSLRATLVAALALPFSIIPTLALMEIFGISFNLISLLGLTLAAGLLVDDAIVEVENIQRRLDKGMEPQKAAETGVRAIGRAVVATTLAVVAVFLPVAFMPGLAGRYFLDFGLTISIASLLSLAVARLVVPPLAARILRTSPPKSEEKRASTSRLARIGSRMFGFCIDHPLPVVLLLIGITLPASRAVLDRPGSFIPENPHERLTYLLIQPLDTRQPETDRLLDDLALHLSNLPGVASVRTEAGLPTEGEHAGRLQIELTLDATDLERSQVGQLLHHEAAGSLVLRLAETGQPRLSLRLIADNPAPSYRSAAPFLLGQLVENPSIQEAYAPGASVHPVLTFSPDPGVLAEFGIDSAAVAAAFALGDPRQANEALPELLLPDGRILSVEFTLGQSTEDLLSSLTLPLRDGGVVPLSTVVAPEISFSPQALERRNGQLMLPIWLEPAPGVTSSQAMQAVRQIIETTPWPEGFSPMVAPSGSEEQRLAMISALGNALLISALTLGATLFALFRSLSRTVVIVLSLPLALVGTFAGLAATGIPLSLPVFLGVMLCLGIVAKNAILILDAAQQQERLGGLPRDAMLQACLERTRPVIMTSLAMIVGMAPAAFAEGEGAMFRQPLAITVMAGIGSATLLSLIAVPALDRLAGRLRPSAPDPLARLARETRHGRPLNRLHPFSPRPEHWAG